MTDDLKQLGEAIAARREELDLTQAELADLTGLHRVTIGRLEKGAGKARPTRATAQALERALGWLPGSVDAVLDGGVAAVGTFDGRFLRVQVDDAGEIVHDLVRRISMAIDPEVPLSRILRAEVIAEEALREAGLLPPLGTPDDEGANSNK